jgi:putative transcriptional regulator
MHMASRFCLDAWLVTANVSQRELALRANVSPTTVNRMARNKTATVSLNTLDALSRELGCEPGDLIERVPEPQKKAKGRR